MKPPVDHVRISAKDKEILLRIKKRTGLEHWNEICRFAYCRSLANPAIPTMKLSNSNTAIDIEWKTFAGQYHKELASLTMIRASKDSIDVNNRETISLYFRAHLQRGITSMQNIRNLSELAVFWKNPSDS